MPPRRRPLDEALALKILNEIGRSQAGTKPRLRRLVGGVSSIVWLAEKETDRFVLKQPLGRFRVSEEWLVDTRRIGVEARFARLVEERLGPRVVFPVVHYDESNEVLVMEAAPEGWGSWKERLLGGDLSPSLAVKAASMLARIHGLAAELAPTDFRNDRLFEQQRLDPYFGRAALMLPEAAEDLSRLAIRFVRRNGLVHGDFSPKNLMTDGSQLRLVDHEVVTRGDEAFDVAFLLNHLLLKAVHDPDRMVDFAELARTALHSYATEVGAADFGDLEARVVAFLGGLHLARALGKSRAEYLTGSDQAVVVATAAKILRDGANRLETAISFLVESNATLRGTVTR